MKKVRVNRFITALLLLSMLTAVAACSSGDTGKTTNTPATTTDTPATTSTTTDTPATTDETPAEPEEPVRDLGGLHVKVSDWWTNNEAPEEPPQNLRDELARQYEKEIQEKYNFTLKRENIGGWGDSYIEKLMASTMAGDPEADIFMMDFGWLVQPMAKGMLYPLSDLEAFDFNEVKWNKQIKEAMTKDGKIYGMNPSERMEPRIFLFFNKRLLAEAGIDPDEPYELQANGTWTWDKFIEYCQKLTRDTNGDGTPDTYAVKSFTDEFMRALMFSNNAKYIGKDANGKFYNATSEPNFLEAVQFFIKIYQEGYSAPDPEGAAWDWFVTAFHDAYAAMIIREEYSVGTWADMEDDWGMVFFPKGPNAKNNDYLSNFRENTLVMSSALNNERAEDVAFAYNLWTQPLDIDTEDPDAWKDFYYGKFRDSRAVDETLVMLYEGEGRGELDLSWLIPGIDVGADFVWALPTNESTPAEIVESFRPKWDAGIAEANGE